MSTEKNHIYSQMMHYVTRPAMISLRSWGSHSSASIKLSLHVCHLTFPVHQ